MIATLGLAILGQIVYGAVASPVSLRSAFAFAWPTWVIALAIVAIEFGYLTAYRSGWTIGTAFAIASTVTIFASAIVGWSFWVTRCQCTS